MKKILLIAGHGKNHNGTYDPGAVSIHGREADYTRELVGMVQQAIGGAVSVDVYDTEKNCYSYSKAGQAPNYKAYDIVMENHFNAKAKKDESGDGSFTGIGAYVHPNNSGGKDIANKIINAVVALGFKKWQLSTSTGLLNLNNAQSAGIDYFLLETAFIDDGDDMKWYNDNKARVAQQIAQVLIAEAGGTVSAAKPEVPESKPVNTEYAPGLYKVIVNGLNIRKGPGIEHDVDGVINDKGTYTVVEMSGSWGKLKSGAGWINCHALYCTRVRDINAGADSEPEGNAKTFEVRVKIKDLNIREGAGMEFEKKGYCPVGVYNIVNTIENDGYTWGKLKSGAGWIALEYVEKLI